MTGPTVARVVAGTGRHRELLATLSAEPVASQWWEDAESRIDADSEHTSYMVVYVPGDGGQMVPAAWAGWRIETGDDGARVLRCCDNYVRQGYRRQIPELYRLAYKARHRQVVAVRRMPAVTYLYPEPIGLHVADGWTIDTSPDAAGRSTPYEGGPEHHWRRLTWTPRSDR